MTVTLFRSKLYRWWRQEIGSLLILSLVLFSVRSSLADWNDVPTGSMKPTILEGDRIWVDKVAYDLRVPFTLWRLASWSNPLRGDVVVFYSPDDGTRLVKRVVGLPGDVVELQNDQLIINGKPVAYAPLAGKIADQIPLPEHLGSQFATEELPTHAHALMMIPNMPAKRDFGPIQVPAGHYFMMGDNRDNSFDSRYFGAVDRKQIVGRATAVVMSLDRKNDWGPRWQRFFKPMDASVSP